MANLEQSVDSLASSHKECNQSELIIIPDGYKGYTVNSMCVPKHYEDTIKYIMISRGLISDRVDRVARDIFEFYQGKRVALLGVLKGCFQFQTDLVDKLVKLNCSTPDKVGMSFSLDFIRMKSYVDSKSGNLQVFGQEALEEIRGQHVLVVEDIIDTGKTMCKLLSLLESYNPLSVRVASLLIKRCPDSSGYRPDFAGFEIPNEFVIGYSLDFNEHYRDLNHICVINDVGITRFSANQNNGST